VIPHTAEIKRQPSRTLNADVRKLWKAVREASPLAQMTAQDRLIHARYPVTNIQRRSDRVCDGGAREIAGDRNVNESAAMAVRFRPPAGAKAAGR